MKLGCVGADEIHSGTALCWAPHFITSVECDVTSEAGSLSGGHEPEVQNKCEVSGRESLHCNVVASATIKGLHDDTDVERSFSFCVQAGKQEVHLKDENVEAVLDSDAERSSGQTRTPDDSCLERAFSFSGSAYGVCNVREHATPQSSGEVALPSDLQQGGSEFELIDHLSDAHFKATKEAEHAQWCELHRRIACAVGLAQNTEDTDPLRMHELVRTRSWSSSLPAIPESDLSLNPGSRLSHRFTLREQGSASATQWKADLTNGIVSQINLLFAFDEYASENA